MACAVALGVVSVTLFGVGAQSYPSKPIRMVTSEVGGGNDILGRVFAQHLRTQFGQNVRKW